MTPAVQVLDPRRDAEPEYWPALRERAGLRADWSWDVLTAQAWLARMPLLVAVLHGDTAPIGVATGTFSGIPFHRNRFVPVRQQPVGVLHVRAPGTSAVPGWWLAEGLTVRDLIRCAAAIGPRCLGLLLRQVSPADLAVLPPRAKLVRPTEPAWTLPLHDAGDLQEWTAGLSYNRRHSLRKEWRRINRNPDIELTVTSGSTVDPGEVANLLRHNESKYHAWFSALPVPSGYLSRLLPRDDVVTCTFRDRRSAALLAVGITLDHPDWPVMRHWSMLPAEQGGVRGAYFHHLMSVVEWAIANGRKGLLLGKGKSEIKSSLGAFATEQSAVAVLR